MFSPGTVKCVMHPPKNCDVCENLYKKYRNKKAIIGNPDGNSHYFCYIDNARTSLSKECFGDDLLEKSIQRMKDAGKD